MPPTQPSLPVNLAAVGAFESTEAETSLDSNASTQPSPVLTPVYTSDAAREIVEEMRRQDQMDARRAVPRHKRRHVTISCSQPLVLEALPRVAMVCAPTHPRRRRPVTRINPNQTN